MSEPAEPVLNQEVSTALARYRQEILRWNRSINLVSRVEPETRIDQLVLEAIAAWGVLRTHWQELWNPTAPPPSWIYLDLGSGAGFPGVVWSLLFSKQATVGECPGHCYLVEPRQKRAAFLERQLRLLDLESTATVIPAPWPGASPPSGSKHAGGTAALVTIKALDLPNTRVVQGWKTFRGAAGSQAELAVIRFGNTTTPSPSDSLDLPVPATETHLHCSRVAIPAQD